MEEFFKSIVSIPNRYFSNDEIDLFYDTTIGKYVAKHKKVKVQVDKKYEELYT